MSIKLPPVLSCQRGTIVTDGRMYSIISHAKGNEQLKPIAVVRHGIRGISAKEDGIANVQRTESAKTDAEAIGVAVQFSFRTIPAASLLFACADPVYRESLQQFISRYFRPGVAEFEEVTRRMARNILNGRWLWRNRVLGEPSVVAKVGEETYLGQGSAMHHFDNYTPDELAFAREVVQAGLMGGRVSADLEGRVLFGFTGAVEVFPSQNMVTDKPKGFARSLYKIDMITRKELLSIMSTKGGDDAGEYAADMIIMGYAALRDQKIGNAIRTIDTWYAADGDKNPISIEPNGANLELNTINRNKNNNAHAVLSKIDEWQPEAGRFNADAAYLIALLIRGGVFSEKEKP